MNASSVLSGPFGRIKLIGGAVTVVFAAGVTTVVWLGQLRHHAESLDVSAHREILLIRPQPLVTRITMLGTIEPSRIINVTVPFDGSVRERLLQVGDTVKLGEPLLVLDTLDLDARIRDAEATWLKAESGNAALRSWAQGPEVSRARRSLDDAEQTLVTMRRKLAETKALLDRGIVPRMEFDDHEQSVRGLEATKLTVQQNLTEVLAQGGTENQRIAALQLENARTTLEALQKQRNKALLLAPAAGIVTRPAKVATGIISELEVGVPVQRGQVLFAIADLETFAVMGRVDEFDINRVAVGQSVEVNAEALGPEPVKGLVDAIAPQSAEAPDSGRIARFDVRILLAQLPESLKIRLRIGMSAVTHIRVYENSAAVIVPLIAVHDQGSGPTVRRFDQVTGIDQMVPVTLGETTEMGVEVRAGIHANDTIVVPVVTDLKQQG